MHITIKKTALTFNFCSLNSLASIFLFFSYNANIYMYTFPDGIITLAYYFTFDIKHKVYELTKSKIIKIIRR